MNEISPSAANLPDALVRLHPDVRQSPEQILSQIVCRPVQDQPGAARRAERIHQETNVSI